MAKDPTRGHHRTGFYRTHRTTTCKSERVRVTNTQGTAIMGSWEEAGGAHGGALPDIGGGVRVTADGMVLALSYSSHWHASKDPREPII